MSLRLISMAHWCLAKVHPWLHQQLHGVVYTDELTELDFYTGWNSSVFHRKTNCASDVSKMHGPLICQTLYSYVCSRFRVCYSLNCNTLNSTVCQKIKFSKCAFLLAFLCHKKYLCNKWCWYSQYNHLASGTGRQLLYGKGDALRLSTCYAPRSVDKCDSFNKYRLFATVWRTP
jgi:hypothetical protein